MITIKQENNFDFLSAEYEAHFAACSASGFQCPFWMDAFYRHLVPAEGAEPLIITFRKGNELQGVVGLVRRKIKGLTLIEATDLGVSDYACPVLRDDLISLLEKDKQLKAQFQLALGSHNILRLRPILPEHKRAWLALFDGQTETLDFSSHAVALQEPFEDWRAENVDKKLASMMARKGKRWHRQHEVVLERVTDPANVAPAIINLAKLREGRFEGDPIQTEPVKDFYASVASAGAANGQTETWMVTSDGDIAGILFGLIHNGAFLYLLIGANYDDHGRHSPGLQMYDWIIEDWMKRGGNSFDFTIGDEPFKQQFGTSAKPMSMILKGNGLLGNLAINMFGKKLRRESNG